MLKRLGLLVLLLAMIWPWPILCMIHDGLQLPVMLWHLRAGLFFTSVGFSLLDIYHLIYWQDYCLAIRSNETIFNANPYKLGLGPEDASRPHQCLGLRTYGLLRNDIDAELDHDYEALDEEAIENRCAASDTSDEEVSFHWWDLCKEPLFIDPFQDTVVAQLIVPQSAEAGSSNAGRFAMHWNATFSYWVHLSYCGFVDAQLRLGKLMHLLHTLPWAWWISIRCYIFSDFEHCPFCQCSI